MKIKYILLFLIVSASAVFTMLYFRTNSLNSKLDDLEEIITKYEPLFDSLKYDSDEYKTMIAEYNKEIFAWGRIFERERYVRDEKGKITYDYGNRPILNKEFNKEVEKRFYDLNDRMTKMVLRNIPRKEQIHPVTEESVKQNPEK